MRLIPFSLFKHRDYVNSVLEVALGEQTGGIVAVNGRDRPKGVFLFDNWGENSVFAHIASQHPSALRYMLSEGLPYIFNTCELGMILTNTVASNAESLQLQKHLGFTELYRIKDGFAVGEDYVILQLLRENCNYVNKLKEVA